MLRRAGADSQNEEVGRESRLMPLLLALALILVAIYASVVSGTYDAVRLIVSHLPPRILWLSAAGFGALVVLAIAGVFAFRRFAGETASGAEVARLPGRAEFIELLAEQIEQHAQSGRQLAIHVVDIDRFSAINEALGEAEGNAFLRLVSERLLILADKPHRLARIGDDEFAIIQPEAGGARHAEIYARRVQEMLKDVCAQVPRHVRPGVSIGIAVSSDGADPLRLLQTAGLALRAAKRAGGNVFRIYAREMEIAHEHRRKIERAIGEGLHQGWFELHFQPQYDLGTRRLTGFEALARMKHPELGEIAPSVFIPIADQSGLIQPLGEWVIRHALSAAGEWPRHIQLSLNISAAQFRHGDVAAVILNALAQTGVHAARLRVEISERVLLEGSPDMDDQLRRLKARGVAIVLDDFGLDASRLGLLSQAHCDAVKLDRELVERIGSAPDVELLVKRLIRTARFFDLDVAAEGIERAEQAAFLVSQDCRKVQGFLFGRPMPAHEVAAVIAKDIRSAVTAARPEPRPVTAA